MRATMVYSAAIILGGCVATLAHADELPSAKDGKQLGRVCNAWTYPPKVNGAITETIGWHNPVHILSVSTDDSFEQVCRHYAGMCGHAKPLEEKLVVAGRADGKVYLIRYLPAAAGTTVPRRVFIQHSDTHTVTVTVMRPADADRTHVDVTVAVR